MHGFTFGGHPVAAAVALANIDIIEREDLCGRVLAHEAAFRAMLEGLRDIPIVGDVRGAGYFQAIELVKDRATLERFSRAEAEALLRGFLAPELYRRGLICRTDDRGDPVIQLAPPLIAGPDGVRRDRVDPAPRADRGGRAMLTVERAARRGRPAPAGGRRRRARRACAGCTAPSCSTRRRG